MLAMFLASMAGTRGTAQILRYFKLIHNVRPEACVRGIRHSVYCVSLVVDDAEIVGEHGSSATDKSSGKSGFAGRGRTADGDCVASERDTAGVQGKQPTLMQQDACDASEQDGFDLEGLRGWRRLDDDSDTGIKAAWKPEACNGIHVYKRAMVRPDLDKRAGPEDAGQRGRRFPELERDLWRDAGL